MKRSPFTPLIDDLKNELITIEVYGTGEKTPAGREFTDYEKAWLDGAYYAYHRILLGVDPETRKLLKQE